MDKYYTYILKSNNALKHYNDSCGDLNKRLADHNYGRVKFTKPFKPWVILYFEEFDSKSHAMKRERFFKTIDGHIWLKSNNII